MRYSQFISETNVGSQTISYNLLTPKFVEGDPDALKPKKIKITAIRIGKNIINDLIVLASFFVSARTKALSDQITITTNIANNINFI